MCSCPEFFLLSGICHTGTDKFSFFSGRCPYHSRDKSQGLRRSPKGLTFTFGSVERAAAYPRHDREIRLFTSICRDSPAYRGQTIPAFYFNLPGLSCIPGTDNFGFLLQSAGTLLHTRDRQLSLPSPLCTA